MNVKLILKKTNKKIAIISLILIMLTVSSMLIVNAVENKIIIKDGETTINISSIHSDTEKILNQAGIKLDTNDLVTTNKVDSNLTEILIKRAFNVKIVQDNEEKNFKVAEGTIQTLLDKENIIIPENLTTSPYIETSLSKDMSINICEAINIQVNHKGNIKTLKVAKGTTVESVLKILNISPEGDSSIVNPSLETNLDQDTVINVGSYEYRERYEIQTIDFKTVQKNSENLNIGETKIETQGKQGEKKISYQDKILNGNVIETNVVNEEIVSNPIDEVKLIGTKVKNKNLTVNVNANNKTITDSNGNTIKYSKVLTGPCTAYGLKDGTTTSTGKSVKHGYIAVDPTIIPYGTKLYISSPNGKVVYGYAEAADTGGAMLSGRVLADLFFDSTAECNRFGRRQMNIYVIG